MASGTENTITNYILYLAEILLLCDVCITISKLLPKFFLLSSSTETYLKSTKRQLPYRIIQ